MNTILRRASAILAASSVLAAILTSTPTAAAAACDPATRAIQYLASKQMADGSIDASLAETADFVLGAASDGVDPNTLKASSGKSVYDFFAADLGTGSPKAYTDANQLGKLIQALVTGHFDPTKFAGKNLLAKLTGSPMYDSSTGAYADGLGGSNQAFTQAQAILGLTSAKNGAFTVPAKALTELKGLRSTSGPTKGGWQAFGSFDTNTTSMALMALTAAGDTAGNDTAMYSDAFGFLRTQQDPNSGGFTFTTDFGTDSDPDSDALVIQALTAGGQDPGSLTWSNAKGNAVGDILSFQDPATGGFFFSHGGKLQAFATSQVPAGLTRTPFPVAGKYSAGATIPAPGCPVAAVVQTLSAATPGLPAAGQEPLSSRPAGWPSPVAPVLATVAALTVLLGLGVAAGQRRARPSERDSKT
jgi:hypothetical protein